MALYAPHWACDYVVDWLERSACDTESTGSSFIQDSYCVGTKFFAHNALQYHCIYAAEASKCTPELCVLKERVRYQRSVGLYCTHLALLYLGRIPCMNIMSKCWVLWFIIKHNLPTTLECRLFSAWDDQWSNG